MRGEVFYNGRPRPDRLAVTLRLDTASRDLSTLRERLDAFRVSPSDSGYVSMLWQQIEAKAGEIERLRALVA